MRTLKLTTLLIIILSTISIGFGQPKKPTPVKPAPVQPKPTPTPVQTTGNRYSDYKISQKMGMGDKLSITQTTWAKGVRDRVETKINLNPNDPNAEMMANIMGTTANLSQCDLKQKVTISDKKKAYFIDYDDWSGLSPEQLARRPVNKPFVIKGTSTISSIVTDSGKRQTMFGLQARWVKHVVTIVNSADSCDGKADVGFEEEGWFVTLRLNSENCLVPKIQGSKGGCRPKLILNGMQDPGFFLEGTRKMYQNG